MTIKEHYQEMISDIKQQIKTIVNNTETGDIREICGVIVSVDGKIELREVKNIAEPMSATDYKMCPEDVGLKTQDTDLFRTEAENKFIGFFHTHPNGSSLPSQIDVRNCLMDKDYYIYSVRDDTLHIFKIRGEF